mgnify:CR=1 FL=1
MVVGDLGTVEMADAHVRLQKKLRASDPDAALYYLARMLEVGEDPLFIARRLVILASEDIGNADPQALSLATSAYLAVEPMDLIVGHDNTDFDALAAAVTDETAAICLEPIQGEAGVVVPPEGYLAAARRVADEHGALLWFDEVQSGIGRTGDWLAHLRHGVVPDVVTLAKGLGGGFPIGAVIGLGRAADLLQPGNHGTTFGGNPVACAAALAVLDTIEADGLLEHVTVLGQKIRDGLAADPRVTEVRGEGLLIGLDLASESAGAVVQAAQDAGFIINMTPPQRIRLAPPLVLTDDDAASFLQAWPGILDAAEV